MHQEHRVHDALHGFAAAISETEDGMAGIHRAIRRRRRRRSSVLAVAGASLVLLVGAAAVQLSDDGTNVATGARGAGPGATGGEETTQASAANGQDTSMTLGGVATGPVPHTSLVAVTREQDVVVLSGTGTTLRSLYRHTATYPPLGIHYGLTPDGAAAYISDIGMEGCGRLYRAATDGTGTAELPYFGRTPIVSPDGRYLAYAAVTGEGPFCPTVAVVVRDLSTGTERRWEQGETDRTVQLVTWSPDGRYLSYTLSGEECCEVGVLDTTSTEKVARSQRLKSSKVAESWTAATYVPDGIVILASCCTKGVDREDQFLLLQSDGKRKDLMNLGTEKVASFDVSPDGLQLVWVNGEGELWRSSRDGSGRLRLGERFEQVRW